MIASGDKNVVQRKGGWFVSLEDGAEIIHEWSGPWRTKQAAELAAQGLWGAAHEAEIEAARNA